MKWIRDRFLPRRSARGLALSHVADLPALGDLVYFGVGYDDRLILATSSADPSRTYDGRYQSPRSASFPHSVAHERYKIDVITQDVSGVADEWVIADAPVAHPLVQPMPDGSLMLVGA